MAKMKMDLFSQFSNPTPVFKDPEDTDDGKYVRFYGFPLVVLHKVCCIFNAYI